MTSEKEAQSDMTLMRLRDLPHLNCDPKSHWGSEFSKDPTLKATKGASVKVILVILQSQGSTNLPPEKPPGFSIGSIYNVTSVEEKGDVDLTRLRDLSNLNCDPEYH